MIWARPYALGETSLTENKTSISEKGSPFRAQRLWCLMSTSQVANVDAALSHTGGSVFMIRGREENGAGPFFYPWRGVSVHAASQRHGPRANNSLLMCPRHSSNCYFHSVCPQVVCLSSLQEQGIIYAPFQPHLLIFKTLGFKHHWLQELMKIYLYHFLS